MHSKSTIDLILNALRRASVQWEGRSECLKRARRQVQLGFYKNGKPRLKFEWQCAKCANWFRDEKEMEVDHIKEIGTFTGCLNDFAKKLFCEQSNLQCLCVGCHLKKTTGYNASTRYSRKVDL